MITTTKEEIRKAVMEALEAKRSENDMLKLGPLIVGFNFRSIADRVAETLGGEG